MWPTMDGPRVLVGSEADLVRRSVSHMIDQILLEDDPEYPPAVFGIDWFDQWDWEQRIWLLQHIVDALLTSHSPPPPAAMWEATIDAVFCNVLEKIEQEIDGALTSPSRTSWRQRTFDAFTAQHSRNPDIDLDETSMRSWQIVVTQIADAILGPAAYQKAELLRDQNIERAERFLKQRGLPDDFLQRIPPLPTPEQTRQSIDRLRMLTG